MTLAIQTLLALIGNLVPLLTSASNANLIASIITTLEQFLPFIINEIASLYQPVKNIISALSATPATEAAQLAQLQLLDQQLDAAFEAIAAETDAQG
jgi:hypothetical protein